jgi:hypothetical protein
MQTETEPTWRRFVSEAESNQQVVDLLKQRAEATRVKTELNTKLEQLAKRFHEVGDNLWRYARRDQNVKLYEDTALSDSLKFGPESGVNVEMLVSMIQERDRQCITIESINVNLRNRGVV